MEQYMGISMVKFCKGCSGEIEREEWAEYCISKKPYIIAKDGRKAQSWWLRTPGYASDIAVVVDLMGVVGANVQSRNIGGVRSSLRIGY